jgi:radical SAM-linked protein
VILVRLRSIKEGKVRFTSHRDVARLWERALRVCEVSMVYSEGYSPRPRIAFGLALPTGSESDAEYIDLQLDDSRPLQCPVAELPTVLSAALPVGIEVTGVAILERGTPSLQQAVTSCVWDITVNHTIDEVRNWTQRVLESSSIVVSRQRKGKEVSDDLRPLLRSLEPYTGSNGETVLRAELGTQPRSVRPSELLQVGEPHLVAKGLRRKIQYIEREGARLEPIQVGAAPAASTRWTS